MFEKLIKFDEKKEFDDATKTAAKHLNIVWTKFLRNLRFSWRQKGWDISPMNYLAAQLTNCMQHGILPPFCELGDLSDSDLNAQYNDIINKSKPVAQPPSTTPNFANSCENVRLIAGVLKARCRKKDGSSTKSAIDLRKLLGNTDGQFKWGEKNWLVTSRFAIVDRHGKLIAELKDKRGKWKKATFDLNTKIGNNDGVLEASSS